MTSFVARHTLTSRKNRCRVFSTSSKITLSRKHRRQPMLCMSSQPSENMTTAMGCQALISSPVGTPHFRKRFQLSGRRCQPPTLFLQLSHGFGRITNEIKPYLPNLPLSSVFLPVPPDAICRETPQLDRGYCNVMRYCLNSQASHSGFP